jgi:hypothetical protein
MDIISQVRGYPTQVLKTLNSFAQCDLLLKKMCFATAPARVPVLLLPGGCTAFESAVN